MKPTRMIMALTVALGLSACGSVDTAMRNATTSAPGVETAPHAQPATRADMVLSVQSEPYAVTQINVTVPETLKVSEANTYFPNADIVWREDPFGNRYEQVQAIVLDAATRGAASHDKGRPVIVDIQITRFHALTEKTRYTIGGTHDIHFYLTVRDAATGEKLEQPRLIETSLKAYGGARALEAMSRGQTQKVRITDHLAALIAQELNVRALPAPDEPLRTSALSAN